MCKGDIGKRRKWCKGEVGQRRHGETQTLRKGEISKRKVTLRNRAISKRRNCEKDKIEKRRSGARRN